MEAEINELLRITETTFNQLRDAFEGIPADKLNWRPAEGAISPRMQIVHACQADRGYANRIDSGSRRTDFDLERELTTKQELLAYLEETRMMTTDLIESQSAATMDNPVEVPWIPDATVRFVLLHMLRHKHYHTGQINMMRWVLGIDV